MGLQQRWGVPLESFGGSSTGMAPHSPATSAVWDALVTAVIKVTVVHACEIITSLIALGRNLAKDAAACTSASSYQFAC